MVDNKKEHQKFVELRPQDIKDLLKLPRNIAIKMFQKINYNLHVQKNNVLKQAFDEKILTEEEYNKSYKDMFYDDYGSDSFIQYLNAIMNAKIDVFVTENQRLLKRRDDLKKKFGLEILSTKEVIERSVKK